MSDEDICPVRKDFLSLLQVVKGVYLLIMIHKKKSYDLYHCHAAVTRWVNTHVYPVRKDFLSLLQEAVKGVYLITINAQNNHMTFIIAMLLSLNLWKLLCNSATDSIWTCHIRQWIDFSFWHSSLVFTCIIILSGHDFHSCLPTEDIFKDIWQEFSKTKSNFETIKKENWHDIKNSSNSV